LAVVFVLGLEGEVAMTAEEKIAVIDFWQDEVPFHPLTCRVESSHAELRGIYGNPTEDEPDVVLHCPTCGHVQNWIPDVVLRAYEQRERR
jgi:hypothetical protein